MRKLIPLLLAAAMLVSLCACGGSGGTPGTDDPPPDNGQGGSAVDFGKYRESDFLGLWIQFSPVAPNMNAFFDLFSSGGVNHRTGGNLTWRFDAKHETLTVSSEALGETVYKVKSYDFGLLLKSVDPANSYELVLSADLDAARVSLFTEVAITLDNWDQYFEFEFVEEWRENSFGETESVKVYDQLILKPAYAGRAYVPEEQPIVFEYVRYFQSNYDCEVDWQNRKFTVGEWIENIGEEETYEFECNTDCLAKGSGARGMQWGFFSQSIEYFDGTMHRQWAFKEFTRIKGSLYIRVK